MAPIKEREEITRSADPNVSKSRAMAAAAQAQQMNVKNKPSGYNGNNANNGRPPRKMINMRGQNNDVAQHRSPVLPSGKESIQLPPIETGRGRAGHGSASR